MVEVYGMLQQLTDKILDRATEIALQVKSK